MSTKIQWTDETWNPTTGCTRVSEGCRHCYIERTPAFRMAGRTFVNGTTGVLLHPDRLDAPLRWKKPRRIFVNSLSDLFHEHVTDEFLMKVFATMCATRRHTYQILTKRPARMLDWMSRSAYLVNAPPSNIWLGVSVEDQATADERIPILLQTPAAVRFVSYEPALAQVMLKEEWLCPQFTGCQMGETPRAALLDIVKAGGRKLGWTGIDWLIAGGESGPLARPCDLAWICSIKDQCQAAGVPVFVKQLGRNVGIGHKTNYTMNTDGTVNVSEYGCGRVIIPIWLKDTKGGDMAEWPTDLRVREYPA